MRSKKNLKYIIGSGCGFFVGAIILHPFSMIFQNLIRPSFQFNFKALKDAFNPHHLPMAFFFGVLGLAIGCVAVFFNFGSF